MPVKSSIDYPQMKRPETIDDLKCLFNFVGLEKTVTEMSTGCLRMMKSYNLNKNLCVSLILFG